jgi:hypothetical protein
MRRLHEPGVTRSDPDPALVDELQNRPVGQGGGGLAAHVVESAAGPGLKWFSPEHPTRQ